MAAVSTVMQARACLVFVHPGRGKRDGGALIDTSLTLQKCTGALHCTMCALSAGMVFWLAPQRWQRSGCFLSAPMGAVSTVMRPCACSCCMAWWMSRKNWVVKL